MSLSSRTKQRFVSVLEKGMIGSCCIRTSVGIESLSRRNVGMLYRSSSKPTFWQHRLLSSARPLPDDDHEEISWVYDEEPRMRRVKRAPPYLHTQQHLSDLNSTASNTFSSTTPSDDTLNLVDHEIVKWDESSEIATKTVIQTVYKDKDNHRHDAASIVSSNSPIEEETTAERENFVSPSTLRYTGDAVIPITSMLRIIKPQDDTPSGIWPVFRLIDENGLFRHPACDGFETEQHTTTKEESVDQGSHHRADNNDPLSMLRFKLCKLFPHQANEIHSNGLLHSTDHPFLDTNSTNSLLRAHRHLIRLRTMDTILQNAQRQGRVSFYMTCTGEEAIHIGAASALENHDPIFAQYREQGLLMWRGFTLEQFTNQCLSNDRDLGKGRQMPIHYGSRALNYHTVSSPLGTQLPQAVGAAYRLKLMKKPNVAICFFGDGCASTTDFHAALNFAATLSVPAIFFCRNNGYAISTPVSDQYAGDGIVSRAPGYGMAAIRVDGNDIYAVHAAVREAKKYALQHNAPVLIEGMTYRLGHHSTSDDSTRYRADAEVAEFADKMDPLVRLKLFLQRYDLITESEINEIKDEERLAVLDAIKLAERRPKPNIDSMFTDVYKNMPLHLQKQLKDLKNHVEKYPDKYRD